MDRLSQKETAGRNLINGRYMLNECLFASELGTLYRARDTRKEEVEKAGTGVLVHFLPNRAVAYNELPGLFPVLQSYGEALNHPVLKVVDYGWSGTVAYFIMTAPESWSTNVLPELQGPPSSLHQSAIRITRDLLNKGIINTGLVPQAFMVMPGGLYLLPTALTEYFQGQQSREALLPLTESKVRSGRWMLLLSWGAAVGFAASGGGYIYHLYQQGTQAGNKQAQIPLVGKSEAQIIVGRSEDLNKADTPLLVVDPATATIAPTQLDRPETGNETLLATIVPELTGQDGEKALADSISDAPEFNRDMKGLAVKQNAAGGVKEKSDAVWLESEELPVESEGAIAGKPKEDRIRQSDSELLPASGEAIATRPKVIEVQQNEPEPSPVSEEAMTSKFRPKVIEAQQGKPELAPEAVRGIAGKLKEDEAQQSKPETSAEKSKVRLNSGGEPKPDLPEAIKKIPPPPTPKGASRVSTRPSSPNIQVSEVASLVHVRQQKQKEPLITHSKPVKMKPVAIEPAPVTPGIPKVQLARVAAVEPESLSVNHPVLLSGSQRSQSPQQKQRRRVQEQKTNQPPFQPPQHQQRQRVQEQKANQPPARAHSGGNRKKGSQRSPKLTANGLTSEELIDSAYKAIRTGQLGEVPGRGAIYFIRLVKRIDRGNPQINRMARKVVSAYHVKAREAIRNKHKNAAQQLLWMAGRVIKEFNLTKMNKSHEILNHRIDK